MPFSVRCATVPRRPLDVVTALSALLLAAWVVLSGLSCAVPAGADLRGAGWRGGVALREGELRVWSLVPDTPANRKKFPWDALRPQVHWGVAVFRSGWATTGHLWWDVKVPFPVVAAATGALPAWWLAGRRRQGRRTDARIVRCMCHVCGYDRRGGTGFTCPECGTAT